MSPRDKYFNEGFLSLSKEHILLFDFVDDLLCGSFFSLFSRSFVIVHLLLYYLVVLLVPFVNCLVPLSLPAFPSTTILSSFYFSCFLY